MRCVIVVVLAIIAMAPVTTPVLDAAADLGYLQFLDRFDADRAWIIVNDLAGDRFEGRESGTRGANLAADYIADYFGSIGLEPAGGDGGYKMAFELDATGGPSGYNVLGFVPGSDPSDSEKSVIIGAHYDGQGRDDDGSILPGANDDASGVAVVMEMARVFSSGARLRWSVIFAAWDGEEVDAVGSEAYVLDPFFPLDQTIAYLNLDMVGGGKELLCEMPRTYNALFQVMNESRQQLGITLSYENFSDDETDQAYFEKENVPNLTFVYWPDSAYHTKADTADHVSKSKMRDVARLTMLMTLKLSEATVIITTTTSTTIQVSSTEYSSTLPISERPLLPSTPSLPSTPPTRSFVSDTIMAVVALVLVCAVAVILLRRRAR